MCFLTPKRRGSDQTRSEQTFRERWISLQTFGSLSVTHQGVNPVPEPLLLG